MTLRARRMPVDYGPHPRSGHSSRSHSPGFRSPVIAVRRANADSGEARDDGRRALRADNERCGPIVMPSTLAEGAVAIQPQRALRAFQNVDGYRNSVVRSSIFGLPIPDWNAATGT